MDLKGTLRNGLSVTLSPCYAVWHIPGGTSFLHFWLMDSDCANELKGGIPARNASQKLLPLSVVGPTLEPPRAPPSKYFWARREREGGQGRRAPWTAMHFSVGLVTVFQLLDGVFDV